MRKRNQQLIRQLKILQILANSVSGKTIAELSITLESNSRNIYRDFESLQEAGVPLYKSEKKWLVIKSKFVELFKP